MDFAPYLAGTTSGAGRYPLIDDRALLECARSTARSPWQTQRLALAQGILPARYDKNLSAISFAEQVRICSARVVVCGCGGLGGTLLTLLARLGVGRLRFADGDHFAASNLNRQWFADTTRIDQAKADAAREQLERINPFCELEPVGAFITTANVAAFLADCDLVVDAFDNIPDRLLTARAARDRRVPFVHGAVAGWWGQIVTLMPDSALGLDAIYGSRRVRDPAEPALGVLGSAAAVIGSLEAMEATRLLCGRPPAYADRMLYFDGDGGSFEWVPLA